MGRLLVLTQTHNLWGGIETWMADLFPALEKAGWDVHFGLAWGARFNSPERFVQRHEYVRQWRPLDGRVGTPTSRSRALISELQRLNPDVVMPIALGDALPALRSFRHGGGAARMLIPVHSTHAGTLADIMNNAGVIDGVGLVSGLLFRWATAALGRPLPKLFWVRNGVPPPTRSRRRSRNGLLRMGFVGRLDAEIKRSHDLIGILLSLQSAGVPVSLRVAGDGPMASELEARFRAVADSVRYEMLGFLPRERLYREVYPELDGLLLTSATEGSPLAVIEAMRHGVVPVVSRFHGHAAERLLSPGENCLTFRVGDHAEAAACIQRLAESPELWQRLSSAAVASTQRYDTDDMIKGWDHALRSVLSAPAREPVAFARGAPKTHGRLERWGISPELSDDIRRLCRSHFRHNAGFDEWPGSLNTDKTLESAVRTELVAIEESCSARWSDREMDQRRDSIWSSRHVV